MNAPDRYERFVVPEGMKKYRACPFFLVALFRCLLACLLVCLPPERLRLVNRACDSLRRRFLNYTSSSSLPFVVIVFRVTYERDMKVMNAATFTVEREDHTVGNVIRM